MGNYPTELFPQKNYWREDTLEWEELNYYLPSIVSCRTLIQQSKSVGIDDQLLLLFTPEYTLVLKNNNNTINK